tara:strand:+ start:171 stop:701 length:531 start_codon:yes stop_codon:yes gene_type:complete
MSTIKVDTVQTTGGVTLISDPEGNYELDNWRLTADFTTNDSTITGWSRNTALTGWSKIGTGMTESSGVFSFPRTGLYSVRAHISFTLTTDDTGCKFQTFVTLNNSSYSQVAEATSGITDSTDTVQGTYSEILVNVTDISNVKVKFVLASAASNNGIDGSTDFQRTGVFFERKGPSQ